MTGQTRFRWVLVLAAILATMALMACGDDGDNEQTDGDDDTGPVMGAVFLGEDDGQTDYQVPHLFDSYGDTMISWRSNTGIYYKNLTTDSELNSIDILGLSGISYGVKQYTVNGNYFVWNSGQAATYRYQWQTAKTVSAQTSSLAPGSCIISDRLGNETFVAAQPGGYMFMIRLAKFTDQQEVANRITLLDPQKDSEPISVKTFACKGTTAWAATQDGRLFDINLYDNTPTLDAPLAENESFELLQADPPYVVWLDAEGDIKMIDVNNPGAPVLAVNIDPLQRATARVADLRIFGSVVVWSDDSEGSFDIWAADLATMENENDYRQITNDPDDQRFPYIYDGKIYWQDNRSGNWEIWSADMPNLAASADDSDGE